MQNKKYAVMLGIIASFSIISVTYAWTWNSSVGNGDSISADKWNSLVSQLISVSVQSDWNASSGYAQILNKPAITNPDWNAGSGLGQIMNKPVIPAAQVNSDWNSVSGVSQILNKPAIPQWTTTGGDQYSSNAGSVGIGTTGPASKLHVNSATTTEVTVSGASSGYVNAALVLKATTDTSYRGLGVFMHDLGGQTEWFAGTPYAAADQYQIGRLGSTATHNTASAQAGYAFFTVKNSGNVGIGTAAPAYKLDVNGTIAMQGKPVIYNGPNDVYLESRVIRNTSSTMSDGMYINYASTDSANNSVKFYGAGNAEMMRIQNNGSVGIGTASPGAKLEVAGTVKASLLDVANGGYFRMNLAHCSGPCASYHALNVWTNIYGYTWSQIYNTDTANFVKSGGTVTINKAGVYRIVLHSMAIPVAASSYVGAASYCPFINGAVNCLGYLGWIHGYQQAGYWTAGTYEFTAPLAAGTTVAFGLYQVQAMTYWCHDSYCSLEITRVN